MDAPVTAEEIEAFRAALEAMLAAHHTTARNVGTPPRVLIMPGARYARIVVEDNPSSRYAYGFIEFATGNLLKSDGWKTPARHPRGNLRNAEPLSGCGPYGMAYLMSGRR
jgi:hypothetical protein